MGSGATIRAREPDDGGYALSAGGVRVWWEVHGGGDTTIVLLPPNPISHSGMWKAQVHHLARHHRVLVYDGRGNGRADAPDPAGVWRADWRRRDCLAAMDASATDSAVLAGICVDGVWPAIEIADAHPERVRGLVAIAAGAPLTPNHPVKAAALARFDEHRDDDGGWARYNRHYIREHHPEFLEWWFAQLLPEPHSARQLEDAVAFGRQGDPDALVMRGEDPPAPARAEAICRRLQCPVLILHGDADVCQPLQRSRRLAELTGGELVVMEGAGHLPNARHPVAVNRLIDDFATQLTPAPARRTWTIASSRRPRVLLVSSPIGLGHAWRDVAIARELRRRVDGLEVHWLAQPPVTRVLEACGEIIHPASAQLAAEATLVDAAGGDHELHAFQMLRHLDEVFCANFMVFHDVVADEPYDAWIGDEAWELDYFLHENPECKTAPYVWLTDFVGVVPMASGGEPEAELAADWNAQMVEHVARYPRLRDRSIFIGDPDDLVDDPLGPGLPTIREWTERHFDFAGYITGFEDEEISDRSRLREEFGFGPDETVCVVAAGGSAVGRPLLEKAIAALPLARRELPGLRMVVVAGPRLDPSTLPGADGLEVAGYVHQLYRRLAACDIAVSHGGLSTTMELTAAERPFLYFPLRDHFEQNVHVHHRLTRYGTGRRMQFDQTSPEQLAAALAAGVSATPSPRPVDRRGAARAAAMIAELLPG